MILLKITYIFIFKIKFFYQIVNCNNSDFFEYILIKNVIYNKRKSLLAKGP